MRLKQLKLAGFKSFANPTTFHFKHTITAIVGPNGCGKSNVIDAVRWVLGESSAKQLRGGAMSDVIFAGSQDKAGKSLASVELVFEHTQADEHGRGGINHPLNLYHELSVRRQITKDGKSDYFINGTKVRRRDIVDIFLGTGLGSRSYAVIEQGMIGRIIDANALQLREFIEEASGVSRYQSRKEDTEKQLQIAGDNLNRLNDMTIELTTQQKRLEKQAKTAQKAQEYQEKIEHINKQLLLQDYNSLINEKSLLNKDYQNLQQQLEKYTNEQQQLQIQQKQLLIQSHEQQILQQEQQNHYQRQWQSQHETQSLYNQQQHLLAEHHAKIQILTEEKQQLQTQIHSVKSNLEKNQTMIANLPNELKNIQIQLEKSKQETQNLTLQRQDIANQISQLHKDKQEYEKQQAIYENSLKNQQQQLIKIEQQQQNHTHKLQKLVEQQQQLGDETNEQQLLALNEKSLHLENQILQRQEQLEEQNELVDSLKTQHQTYERQRQTWQTEQDTLYNLVSKQEQFLQKIKQSQKNNQQLPLLLENLRLSEQGKSFAKQFDELLSIFSQWVLIDKQMIAQITGQFASLFTDKSLQNPINLPKNWVALQVLFEKPVLPILQHIYFNLEPIALSEIDDILSNLNNNWLLVQTIEHEVWLFSPYFCINFNQLYQKDSTTEIGHHFSHQLRIDELQGLLDKQTIPLENLNKRLQEALISLQEWQAQDKAQRHELKILNDKIQQLNHEKIRQTHQKNQWQQDKIRIGEEADLLANDKKVLQNSLDKTHQSLIETQQNLLDIKPILSEIIKQREHFDSQIAFTLTNQKQLETTANELTIALTKGQLQQQHEQDNLVKLNQQVEQNTTQMVQLQSMVVSLEQNLPNLAKQLEAIQEKMLAYEENLQITSEQLGLLENQKAELQQKIDDLQTRFHDEQQIFYTMETKLALCEQKIEQVLGKIQQYQLDVANLAEINLLTVEQVVALQQEQSQLQQKLTQLGAVNYSAVAELVEVNDRLLPLNKEMTDLTDSIAMLRQAITEIDEQTKQLFMSMLQQVNHDLNQLFSQVFGGGQAQLVLSEDNWQSGLELMAQPKGKKNSRLALLSGGEKTLTALSLVFAIFKQQPAPFCVLDEVDAPLDDANVERFTNLIKDLAKDVQFIFISHNKLAMQVADELKGITMPTAGISTLVSVDMKDVSKYLD